MVVALLFILTIAVLLSQLDEFSKILALILIAVITLVTLIVADKRKTTRVKSRENTVWNDYKNRFNGHGVSSKPSEIKEENYQNHSSQIIDAHLEREVARLENIGKTTGEIGEAAVSYILKNSHAEEDFFLVDDFTFRNSYGGSVQIDHLLVSKKGIFVIETKNWNAMEISGGLESENWIVKYSSFQDYEVQNPYIQNSNHIKSLIDRISSLRGKRIHNIVVLAGTGFYRDLSDSSRYVTTLRYLKTKIERLPDIYNSEEVRFFKNTIISVYENIDSSEHVKNVENYKKWKEESKK